VALQLLRVPAVVTWSQPRRFSGRLRARAISLGVASFFLILESTPAANLTDELRPSSSLDFQSTLWLDSDNKVSTPDLLARDAGSTSDRVLSYQSIGPFRNINLSQNQNLTVTGAPGATVVLSLTNFVMSGSSTLTLQGTATTAFVINVSNQFSLSGRARIILSGGVDWRHVFFNVRGKGGTVTLSGNSSLVGILAARQRTVRMSDNALVTGQVWAKKVTLLDSSRIIEPPVVSPEQPPIP